MRSIDILVLFGIRRNCQRSGRGRPILLFIRRVIKQFVVILEYAIRRVRVNQDSLKLHGKHQRLV